MSQHPLHNLLDKFDKHMQLQHSGFLNWFSFFQEPPQQVSKCHLGKADMKWMAEWELPWAAVLVRDCLWPNYTRLSGSCHLRATALSESIPDSWCDPEWIGSMVPPCLWRSRINPQSRQGHPKSATLCCTLGRPSGQAAGPTAVTPEHEGVGRAAPVARRRGDNWGEDLFTASRSEGVSGAGECGLLCCHTAGSTILPPRAGSVLPRDLQTRSQGGWGEAQEAYWAWWVKR